MTVVVLVGGQWGEEGKGKITELLSEQSKVVARFSGGGSIRQPVASNLGHFNLQFIPRSIFSSKAISVLSAGMIIDPRRLLQEMDELARHGVDLRRLFISEQCHVVMPYHSILEEQERRAYGTPSVDALASGFGPAFADKMSRIGIRMSDLVQEEMLLSRLSKVLAVKNDILTKVFSKEPLSLQQIYHEYVGFGRRLRERMFDTRLILQRALESDHRILLESDQGSMLDLDFGPYPYVSNIAPTAGAATFGSGVPPSQVSSVIGVFSAYITRHQTGPFPTEMSKEEAAPLTLMRMPKPNPELASPSEAPITPSNNTGHARRHGWFDAVAARFVAQLNGMTSMVLTHLDGLDTFATIKICTRYQVYDAAISRFPSDLSTLRVAQPVYEEMPGWLTTTAHITSYAQLPPNCKDFIQRIQTLVGVPISIISTSPERDDNIILRDPFLVSPGANRPVSSNIPVSPLARNGTVSPLNYS
jgi:adenylosuccinate synthase